jgi:MoxR-like ATPase
MKGQTNYFAGRYVDDVRDLYLASILSGLHCVAMSGPGWGKTDIALSMARDIAPANHAVARLHPATPPEEVRGAVKTDVLLASSRIEYEVQGTPYDPANRLVIIDEIGRANKVVVSMLMFLLDRKDVAFPPPVWATSNFMPAGPEAKARLDRIALWHWILPNPGDIGAMLQTQLQANNSPMHV